MHWREEVDYVTCKGDLLAVIGHSTNFQHGLISLYDVKSCTELQTMRLDREFVMSANVEAKPFHWSPDSKKLAVTQSCWEGQVVLGCLARHLSTKREVRQHTGFCGAFVQYAANQTGVLAMAEAC